MALDPHHFRPLAQLTYDLEALDDVVKRVHGLAQEYPIWLFDANMGSGKTTFIKALMADMQSYDPVSSPTFSIVNTYRLVSGPAVHHFDLYRAKSMEELDQIGIWEYLDSGNLCLIEWPELIWPALSGAGLPIVLIKLDPIGPTARQLTILKLTPEGDAH